MTLEFSLSTIKPTRHRQKASMTRRHAHWLPGIVKTLVLAHQIERAIAEGRAKDYADVARQMGVSRNRLSQITSFLLLSSKIQGQIIQHAPAITERQLRPIMQEPDWTRQEAMFSVL